MTETVLDIKHWGNNLGVHLPAAIARAAHLRADQRVRISVKEGQVVIRPIADSAIGLEQGLAQFDPARRGMARRWPASRSGRSGVSCNSPTATGAAFLAFLRSPRDQFR